MPMSKQRQLIWSKSGGKCWYCGCDLPKKGWHADHYYPVVRKLEENKNKHGMVIGYKTGKECLYPEFDCVENLVPACAPCNSFKSSLPPEAYRSLIQDQFVNTIKYSTGLRQLNRLGLVDLSPKPVVFWFEKQGIAMPTQWDLMGISDEALSIEWCIDKSEPDYYHQWIRGRMITLRRISNYWLIIAIETSWDSSNRTEIPNVSVDKAKAQAAEWAIRLDNQLKEQAREADANAS